MRLLSVALLTLTTFTLFSIGAIRQQRALEDARHTRGAPAPLPKGTVASMVTPVEAPNSLEDLVREADVVVEGTVESQLQARLRNPTDPASIETDAIFRVDRVFKGRPDALRKLVITEIGGKLGDFQLVPQQYSLLRPGDRHILFLKLDGRPIVPTYTAVDGNFDIVGVWSGNFRIESDRVQTNPRSLPGVREHNSLLVDDVMNKIIAAVQTQGQK